MTPEAPIPTVAEVLQDFWRWVEWPELPDEVKAFYLDRYFAEVAPDTPAHVQRQVYEEL